MIGLDLLQFIGSMFLIYLSAELIIKYGKVIAAFLGVSKYVIGLTLIAFGTSFPEFVVSVNASIINESGIVFGNIIGSNIANIALVLAVCGIIKSIAVDNIVKQDLYFFLFSAFIAAFLAMDGEINRLEGIVLLSGFIFYCYRIKKKVVLKRDDGKKIRSVIDPYILIIICCSFFILIVGSNLFIDSAISLAEKLNISTLAISMTMVAIGTSLPELATSIVAITKKEYELLAGNIIGSNIMNLLMILGPSAIINNVSVDIAYISLALMCSLTALIYIFNIFNIKLTRIIGLIFLIIYGAFIYSNFYII